jgi:hypothetical protein
VIDFQIFLKKLTFIHAEEILEMFPDAQFINIYRNPYNLYYSMMRFLRIVVPRYCIQKPNIQILEKHMLDLYVKMYKKYFEEELIFRLPLSALGEPEMILASIRAYKGSLPIEATGFRKIVISRPAIQNAGKK